MTRHPAKFTDTILDALAEFIEPGWTILDPFAGTGRIHALAERCGASSVGVEIEPEWASLHPATVVGDALDLPAEWTGRFDAVVTSPTYGNRMADHHEAKDGSKRVTYRHYLGRPLHPNNSGQLQWGRKYRDFHERAWREALRVLKPGGLFIVNVKDHPRRGVVQPVADWHCRTIAGLGLEPLARLKVETPGMGFGANLGARVPFEWVLVFRRPDRLTAAVPADA